MEKIQTIEQAVAVLDDARAVVAGTTSRLSRGERMRVLRSVYRVTVSDELRPKLREHIAAIRKSEGADRSFILSKNDYTLFLRYVFPTKRDRGNVSRYAGALAELRDMNVPSERFDAGVKSGGGIVELYWRHRGRGNKTQLRSKISLNRNVEFTSGVAVTLRLLPSAGGVFSVLSVENEK